MRVGLSPCICRIGGRVKNGRHERWGKQMIMVSGGDIDRACRSVSTPSISSTTCHRPGHSSRHMLSFLLLAPRPHAFIWRAQRDTGEVRVARASVYASGTVFPHHKMSPPLEPLLHIPTANRAKPSTSLDTFVYRTDEAFRSSYVSVTVYGKAVVGALSARGNDRMYALRPGFDVKSPGCNSV